MMSHEHDKIKYSYSVVCPIVVYNGVVPVQEGAWGKNPACMCWLILLKQEIKPVALVTQFG